MFASLSSLLRKPLLVEKPLSLDIREAEQMVAKAEEKGVQLELFEVCGRKGYLQVENIVEGVKLFLHDDQTVTARHTRRD